MFRCLERLVSCGIKLCHALLLLIQYCQMIFILLSSCVVQECVCVWGGGGGYFDGKIKRIAKVMTFTFLITLFFYKKL